MHMVIVGETRSSRLLRRLLPGALLGLSVAVPVAAQKPVERDSAGIRIVENPSRLTAPVIFKLGARVLDIGGPSDNPDNEFPAKNSGSVGAFRMSDGKFYITEGTRIGVFGKDGTRISTIGRAGAGPQEFRSVNKDETCMARGDTLVTNDLRNGRFASIYKQVVVRTTPLKKFGGTLAGCFDDGTLLFKGGSYSYKAPSYSISLTRVGANGSEIHEFEKLTFRTPDPVTHSQTPSIRVWGQHVYVGNDETNEILVFRADGKLVQSIRTADSPQRITAADAERSLASSIPVIKNRPHPETFPRFSHLKIDPLGRVWVQDFSKTFPEREGWTAFDSSGRLIGRLEVPRFVDGIGYAVVSFGANEVQLVHNDADGFVHLTFYPIVRR